MTFAFLMAAGLQSLSAQGGDPSVYVPEGTRIPAKGEFIEQLQKRDSILIGDQFLYGFVAEDIKKGTAIALPMLQEDPRGGIMVVEDWKLDTLSTVVQDNGRPDLLDIRGVLKLTSFDEGIIRLPPIHVLLNTRDGRSDTLVYSPLSVEIKTMPVDTATFKPHPVTSQMDAPFTFEEFMYYLRELLPWIILGIWGIILMILAVCLFIMRHPKKKEAVQVRREPPHVVALRKLDAYRSNAMWVPERQKEFYSGVTDAVREYMAERYGIGAMEMTTAEIFDVLKDCDVSSEMMEEMKSLFVRADYVKFAKYVATDEDNASVVPQAVRFVTDTYRTALEEEQAAASQARIKE